MKLTITLLLFAVLAATAGSTYSQSARINLKMQDASLVDVFREIERTSEFGFFFKSEEIDLTRRVSIDLKNVSIEEVLKKILMDNYDYRILDKNIVVTRGNFSTTEVQQQKSVTGKVTDYTGEGLPGVSVVVKGTIQGAITNPDGAYIINNVPSNATLVFSFVGMRTQEVAVGNQTSINIKMEEETLGIEEVVAVGYSTQNRRDITGSISILNMENYASNASSQIGSRLQGRVSGVSVVTSGSPGAAPDIRIRGINTFGDNAPLYVVDGVPTTNINNFNPDDVESMQVLKDASAASIYGARAANGVIIITTRKGKKGAMTVNYRTYSGYEVPMSGNVWNVLNPMGQAELRWLAFKNSGLNPRPDALYGNGETPRLPDYIAPAGAMEGSVDHSKYNLNPEYVGGANELNSFVRIIRANHEGTNWWDEIMRNAFNTNHDFSVSNGTELGNYLFSVNYRFQEGTQYETLHERITFRANSQFNVKNNIRIGENLTFSKWNRMDGNAIGDTRTAQPIIPVHDINGNLAGNYGTSLGGAANPTASAYRRRNNTNENYRVFGNTFAEIDFLKYFKARVNLGVDLNFGRGTVINYPGYESAEPNSTHGYSELSDWGSSYTLTNIVSYLQHFKDHRVEALIGTEAHENKNGGISGSGGNYFSLLPDYLTLGTAGGQISNASWRGKTSLLSFFTKVDYSYENKYIFSATIRHDGSSKLLENRWGTFPAASLGWRISSESFMKEIDWITDLRFRVGFGIMGNERNIAADNAYSTYEQSFFDATYATDGIQNQPGFRQARIGNPYAVWEKNSIANIGIDATIFKDRLEFSVEYYDKSVDDLLFNPERVASQGTAAAPYVNVASMSNTGIDASLSSFIKMGKDARLNATLTFTSYSNKIDKVSNISDYFSQTSLRFNTDLVRNQVGHPVSSFYGYKIIGFWNSLEEIAEANSKAAKGVYQQGIGLGRFRYADITGDNIITPDDRTFIGNPNPDFTTGLDLRMSFRNFDISAFFYASVGNDIWNQNRWWLDMYQSFAGAKSKTALYDSWRPDNQNAKAPIQELSSNISTSSAPNSYCVEDGSFLKLKSFVLGYNLPQNFIRKIGLSHIKVYAQAENLFTITRYSGLDPEIPGGGTSFGIDDGFYLAQRKYLLGLELSF